VAVVTGEAGRTIQAWREKHDPEQARRLPPHATLCYWVPAHEDGSLEQQVRHAFAEPVQVTLGAVRQFDNEEQTFYVEVMDTAALDEARRRLYDGRHLALPSHDDWTWHVTCVRDSRGRDGQALSAAAAGLAPIGPWRIDTVAYMELRGDRYEALGSWCIRGHEQDGQGT
jgi:hypothetical protein